MQLLNTEARYKRSNDSGWLENEKTSVFLFNKSRQSNLIEQTEDGFDCKLL